MSVRLVIGGTVLALVGTASIGALEFVQEPTLADTAFLLGVICYGVGLVGILGGLYVTPAEHGDRRDHHRAT